MTDEIRTATFQVTKQHFPSILSPHNQPSGDPRYVIRCPAEMFPEVESRTRDDGLGPMVNASSIQRPALVLNDDTYAERRNWEELVACAARWNYPINYLLFDRTITVAGRVWYSTNEYYRGKPRSRSAHASLVAVKVHGTAEDFERDEALAAHILEVKGWFDTE